ncbi:hypothetical protein I5H99_gp081 [Mycobacterium phage WillSterrel]|uniref:Uncharacterized protein n=1 Tax=Mycobacterium phage WillSterrel TaxID=1897769 RepID=A0A1C9M040_9CAUD|nr:hypothetical protein I5H99_gp081 [Mycobacterium phage WillSterrel]AOQ28534.1 hypothetical protein SEA_WILLSTERREL_81 [Mycobacterium phage WillSterrel]AYQ99596.1 hypothetical protein PBI_IRISHSHERPFALK_82 [Mycobacterium phage IrishSherpFalk]
MSDVVERAKAALEGVTEGPWIAEYSSEEGNCVIPHDAESTREAVATTHLYHQRADAEFIAQARTLVPELVAEVEHLRPRVIETVEQVDALPTGSVVIDDMAGVLQRENEAGGWLMAGYEGLNLPILPARVLYIPTDSLEEA